MQNLVYLIISTFFFSFANSQNNKDLLLLKNAINNDSRSLSNKKRDKYRNPYETLVFFGINREMKVLEISPGKGWYSEIISKFMRGTNNFYVTRYEPAPLKIIEKNQKEFEKYFKKNQSSYGEISIINFNGKNILEKEVNNFDLVLTFRNSHNWLSSKTASNVYKSIHGIMKKGAVLGVVQHRAHKNLKQNFKNGYVKESFLINFIEEQGFKFIEKSEINSNPKDLKNYKDGVWTLPPRLILKDVNKQKYLDIGESDRMTLKFIKL